MNILISVLEMQHKGLFIIKYTDTLQTEKHLYSIVSTQALIRIHNIKF